MNSQNKRTRHQWRKTSGPGDPPFQNAFIAIFSKKSTSRTTSKPLTKVIHPQRLLQAWLQLWPAFFHHTEYWQQLLQLALPGLDHYPIFQVTSRCHWIHIERNRYKNTMSIFPTGGLHFLDHSMGFLKGISCNQLLVMVREKHEQRNLDSRISLSKKRAYRNGRMKG